MRHVTPGSTERSGPHRRVEKWLDEATLGYMSEEKFPPYTVDIYLPEWHLAIEIDGPLHSPKKDRARDEYLQVHYGLRLLRIKSYLTKPRVMKAIVEFIEEHEPTTWERKQIWLTVR